MKKKQKTKTLTSHGNLTTSNLNSSISECITLTYDVYNAKTVLEAKQINDELKSLDSSTESTTDIIIHNYGTKDESVQVKYKVKKCGSDEDARETKEKFDKYIKKKGGQTTLTEQFDKDKKE